jgi:putative colanic acid biosynthesis glycosyltransferase
MPTSPPILSVIVVCRNSGPRLQPTLESVWEQRGERTELIVIDGGSTDGTREWLESRRARITTLDVRPNRGIYDAMNKGLAAAHGEWVLFLGAGDRLAGDLALSEACNWLKQTEAGVAVGEATYGNGRTRRLRSRVNPIAWNFVPHQAAFYRRALFIENGNFEISLTVMGDYELNLRLWKSHVRFKPLKLHIAVCHPDGASDAGHWRACVEEILIRHRYFPAWKCWLWDTLSVVRRVRPNFWADLRRSFWRTSKR